MLKLRFALVLLALGLCKVTKIHIVDDVSQFIVKFHVIFILFKMLA